MTQCGPSRDKLCAGSTCRTSRMPGSADTSLKSARARCCAATCSRSRATARARWSPRRNL